MMKHIIRVFPRRTKATPDDAMVRIGLPGLFDIGAADEVHISVAFTWDIPRAERLAKEWNRIAPVKLGGPAFGKPSGVFIPGIYLKDGYVITSRGCPNRCWFCSVPKREPRLIELPIYDGWNVLDDNLLACSRNHILAVFGMLNRQKRRVEFTGGLEAKRLEDWHVDLLCSLRRKPVVFFAYDTPDDWEPLRIAVRKMLDAGFTTASHYLRCYVLCGFHNDLMEEAESRMLSVLGLGCTPMAMLYRDNAGKTSVEWRQFQRRWARPSIIHAR